MAKAPSKAHGDVGHNNPPVGAESLRSIVDRIERLNEEKAEVTAQIKEVLGEAKGNGFDTKVIRRLVSIRAKDRAKLLEENAILDLYAVALGCEDLV